MNRIIIIIILCTSKASSQNIIEPVYLSKNYTSVSDFLKQESRIEDLNICEVGLILLKFNIDTAGKVQNIHFSKNALPAIKNAVKQALLRTNGCWTARTIESKKVMSKNYIVPIFLSILNCTDSAMDPLLISDSSVTSINMSKVDSVKKKFNEIYTKRKNEHKQISFLLERLYLLSRELFLFDDDAYFSMQECIVLKTVFVQTIR